MNGGSGAFDPKVFYDPYGGRWIFTSCDDARAASSGLLIGVSQTSDPFGMWNLYKIDVDAANLVWADYPSLGFNKDWIVVQVNMFTHAGSFDGSNVYVFDKSNLYSGGAGAFTLFQGLTGGTQVPAVTYDSSLSTLYLLQRWNSASGVLQLYQITGAVGSESLSAVAFVTSPQAWVTSPGSVDFAPQLGSVQKFQNNDARMQSLVYRNGSLWAIHTIFLPAGGAPTRASVQWWEITPAGAITQRGRIDDGTGATFYAFPSIAVNMNDDVLIGYSRFSASQYASANYSFRASADAVNTLRADTVLKAGEAPYYKTFSGTENRWGDYSHTVVDPVNDIDLWTIQEYAATPSGGTDRWGTWWGKLDLVPNTAPSILAAAAPTRQQGSPGAVSTIATVSDAETSAGSLLVTTTSVPAGLSVTGITNTAGTVTATVAASCGATLGANTVGLEVSDGDLTDAADLTVNVVANTVPVLGTYPATGVPLGGGAPVNPSVAPADNGLVTGLTAAATSFTGSLVGDAATGVVTVANASPAGSFTVDVTATDNCGATTQTSFGLTVIFDPGAFFTVTPCRVFDTRSGAPLTCGTAQDFTMIGGACGLPASATAVSLNVTVTQATAQGNLRLFSSGTPVPLVSTLNYVAGLTRANNAVAPLSASGQMAVLCAPSGTTHVIVDVNGYFQ